MIFFNSEIYKNANIAILGTSGAGKTFCLQLMALRMRRKNIQVFIIAPEKGHELARACKNIGGAYLKIAPRFPIWKSISWRYGQSDQKCKGKFLDGQASERSELAMKIQSLHIFLYYFLIPGYYPMKERQLLDEAFLSLHIRKKRGLLMINAKLCGKSGKQTQGKV